ncbi:MFS transporter [Sulfobacillus thermosulfidooxidans]|uniref:MFS transporter n=1 Tax=Sulfobacillus thermosulfidooxidans TaxID=28034 RepID=UPI0006B50C29|nr:MFS transporter [Sulfobacillus thermosulfidooxidans]
MGDRVPVGHLLADRNFRLYLLSGLVSGLGDAMFMLALTWIIVKTTGSSVLLGLLMASMSIPQIVLSMFAGAVVDRLNPRLLMIVSDTVRLVVMVFLFVMSLNGTPPIWSLFAMAVAFGAMDALFWPAASSFEQRLVAPDYYIQASGLVMAVTQGSEIVGPAIAGILIASRGSFTLITIVNALTFLVSALCLVKVQSVQGSDEVESGEPRSLWKDMAVGVKYVTGTPLILITSLSAFVLNASVAAHS